LHTAWVIPSFNPTKEIAVIVDLPIEDLPIEEQQLGIFFYGSFRGHSPKSTSEVSNENSPLNPWN